VANLNENPSDAGVKQAGGLGSSSRWAELAHLSTAEYVETLRRWAKGAHLASSRVDDPVQRQAVLELAIELHRRADAAEWGLVDAGPEL
jgi:hypothetical protein